MKKLSIIEGSLATLMPQGPNLELEVLGDKWEIKNYGVIDEKQFEEIADSDALIARTTHYLDSDQISKLKKARVIVTIGVGYDHIDIDAAAKMKIPVCNVPDYGVEEVADSAVSMILAHQRKLFLYKHKSRDHIFSWDYRIHKEIKRSSKLTVGIIGLGRIGKAVAMRLKPFNYNLVFYDPNLERGVEKSLGLNRTYDMKHLLQNSNIITFHAPLNNQTENLANDNFFNTIREDAIIVNTARGGFVESLDILQKNLRDKKYLRIATDVLPNEPPEDHSLIRDWRTSEDWLGDRLIITPHSAFYSEEACYDLRKFSVDIINSVFNGDGPYNIVNSF